MEKEAVFIRMPCRVDPPRNDFRAVKTENVPARQLGTERMPSLPNNVADIAKKGDGETHVAVCVLFARACVKSYAVGKYAMTQ